MVMIVDCRIFCSLIGGGKFVFLKLIVSFEWFALGDSWWYMK